MSEIEGIRFLFKKMISQCIARHSNAEWALCYESRQKEFKVVVLQTPEVEIQAKT